MLNPFGLIILIALPAIKTTDAFVQLWGPQNVTKRFWRQQGAFFWRLIYDSLLPPPPPPTLLFYHHRLQQRAGAPHHAGQASLKMYTRLLCQISQSKDSPFSTVSGEIFPVLLRGGFLLCLCLIECVCMCRHANHFVRARLGVLHFGEDQNKPDIFKQLALVYLCGIASCVVFLVNQLKCGSGLCGSSPCCLHAVFAFQADTNTSRLLPTCKTVSVAAEKFLQFAFCGDEY